MRSVQKNVINNDKNNNNTHTQRHETCLNNSCRSNKTRLIITEAYWKAVLRFESHTFFNSLDSDEETLWRCLIVSITEKKVETVMTFEPTECSVFVPQAVHLHIILCKVLTSIQVSESCVCLHTVT